MKLPMVRVSEALDDVGASVVTGETYTYIVPEFAISIFNSEPKYNAYCQENAWLAVFTHPV